MSRNPTRAGLAPGGISSPTRCASASDVKSGSEGPEPEPVQGMDPMMMLYAGAALAELQRQQRPRSWQFWRRGQEQSELGIQGLIDQPEPVAIEGGVVQHAAG